MLSPPATPRHLPAAEAEAAAVLGFAICRAQPHALFFANHPARRGLDSPHELRAWSDAGPDVMRGFEGAPVTAPRRSSAFPAATIPICRVRAHSPAIPVHSYRTWGGYDYYVAKVGGLWDSLLGEGRAFYITANSDSHRFHGDRRETDRASFKKLGYIQLTGRTKPRQYGDMHDPDRTTSRGLRPHLRLRRARPRCPSSTACGAAICGPCSAAWSKVELWAHDGRTATAMGGTLLCAHGADVEIVAAHPPAADPTSSAPCPPCTTSISSSADPRPRAPPRHPAPPGPRRKTWRVGEAAAAIAGSSFVTPSAPSARACSCGLAAPAPMSRRRASTRSTSIPGGTCGSWQPAHAAHPPGLIRALLRERKVVGARPGPALSGGLTGLPIAS